MLHRRDGRSTTAHPHRQRADIDIARFTTSWLVSPFLLSTLRASISLYAFVVLLTIIGHDRSRGADATVRRSFSYFTVLTYWGLAFYFAFAAAHTASYALQGRSYLQRWPVALQRLHAVFYCTITVYPFLVTSKQFRPPLPRPALLVFLAGAPTLILIPPGAVVFWSVLSYGALKTRYSTWSNISEHTLNSAFALFEIALPRTEPPRFVHIVPLLLLLALYLALAYTTYATAGIYVYVFLNPRAIGAGGVAGAVVGIAAAAVLLFLVVRYLIKFRLWVTEDRPGSAIRASANADAVHASACDDVGLAMGNVGTRPRESRGVLPL
ncbi:hypothetical protein LTR50_006286 [Elasticomyces elasticus]|nr:hypothetical protein LTR50_006286 [Elasticomyces elasticus]